MVRWGQERHLSLLQLDGALAATFDTLVAWCLPPFVVLRTAREAISIERAGKVYLDGLLSLNVETIRTLCLPAGFLEEESLAGWANWPSSRSLRHTCPGFGFYQRGSPGCLRLLPIACRTRSFGAVTWQVYVVKVSGCS